MPYHELTDVIDEANEKVTAILSTMKRIKPVGLDTRLPKCWVSDDCLVIRKSDKPTYDYYGGFEYIDKQDIHVIGDYVIYSDQAERIHNILDIHGFTSENT